MKQFLQSLASGFMIGITIGIALSLIFSFIFGQGQYVPLSTVSTMGEIYYQHLSEPMIMLLCVIIWGCIGILFTLTDFIFTQTDWSLLKMTLIHSILSYAGFLPLAILAGWFPLDILNFLIFTFIFMLVYLIIWMINYVKNKRFIDMVNQKLK